MRCRLAGVCSLLMTLAVIAHARPKSGEELHTVSDQWRPVLRPTLARAAAIPSRPLIDHKTTRIRMENADATLSSRISRLDNEKIRQDKAANPAIRDSIQAVTSQLLVPAGNKSLDILDMRTPPKIKMQQKLKENKNSGVGVAIPVDEKDIGKLEEQTKRVVVHRNNNRMPSTTDGGISTWILLNTQSTTVKSTTSTKPSQKNPPKSTTTSTSKPATVKVSSTTVKSQVASPTKIVNKIKASILANSLKNKINSSSTTAKPTQKSTPKTTTVKSTPTTSNPVSSTTTPTPKVVSTTAASILEKVTVEIRTKPVKANKVKPILEDRVSTENPSSYLPAEPKEGDLDLDEENSSSSTTKRPKRPNNGQKKKKNKNRRRKPVGGNKNSTKNANNKIEKKEKPISTQIYNYLSREVMPTVGMGLVGLVVTAGLASYFFYPFGSVALRRNYDIADRKDDRYYYNDDEYNPGGLSEEEAIGKVIAGMPASSAGFSSQNYVYRNRYRTTDSKNRDATTRYRYSTNPSATSYAMYSSPYAKNSHNSGSDYADYSNPSAKLTNDVVAEHQRETGYTVAATRDDIVEQQRVNYDFSKEQEVTPAVVPEHGPRSLKIRRRRDAIGKESSSLVDGMTQMKYKKLEHGPRRLKIRMRRDAPFDKQSKSVEDNEVSDDRSPSLSVDQMTQMKYEKPDAVNDEMIVENNATNDGNKLGENIPIVGGFISAATRPPPSNNFSFLSMIQNLLEFKFRFGMSLLQHTSDTVSRYLTGVQSRMEQVLRDIRTEEEERQRRQNATMKATVSTQPTKIILQVNVKKQTIP